MVKILVVTGDQRAYDVLLGGRAQVGPYDASDIS